MELLEQIKAVPDQDVTRAKKAVYSVCERLKNESDFGSGSPATIECENEIATCLKNIESSIAGLYRGTTVEDTTKYIEMMSQKILGKLKVRIELNVDKAPANVNGGTLYTEELEDGTVKYYVDITGITAKDLNTVYTGYRH